MICRDIFRQARLTHWQDEEEEGFGRREVNAERIEMDQNDVDEFGRPLAHKQSIQSSKRKQSRQKRAEAKHEEMMRRGRKSDNRDDAALDGICSDGSTTTATAVSHEAHDGWITYGDSDIEREAEQER